MGQSVGHRLLLLAAAGAVGFHCYAGAAAPSTASGVSSVTGWSAQTVNRPLAVGCETVLSQRYQVFQATGVEPELDALYVHGFADRVDNHPDLFKALAGQGRAKVVGYELPFHGETYGIGAHAWLPFQDVERFEVMGRNAMEVERSARDGAARPFVPIGWSTGGLLVVRMVQLGIFEEAGRRPAGVVLHAPGIAVKPIVGSFGFVTLGTLTDGLQSPLAGPIYPRSPFFRPHLSLQILRNSRLAREEPYPLDLPTLIVLGGEREDRYVDTAEVARWAEERLSEGARIWVVRTRLPHALDWDDGPAGERVRSLSAAFGLAAARGNPARAMGGPPGFLALD